MPIKVELQERPTEEFLSSLLLTSNCGKPAKKKPNRIKGNFLCTNCNRNYIRKDSLQRHVTYECGKEPQFPCPFCPQKCKRRTHQIRHIKRQHPDQIGLLAENNPHASCIQAEIVSGVELDAKHSL
ncbi:longitudinals lacking protein, isoforms F/I/K/T-like [Cylas formicarius]|uniref:longitudinals lacking protein, isoforms F/I/K/T-like n=1 Tax=Cylas formicarius TaxID=197179 RepID=UPI002958A99C|nr:longitudinals lacking protein, isoforms F/I/K/T-like [Cylas formicarius]